MITDLHDSDFPETYDRLVKLFPERPWLKRVDLLRHQITGNPLQADVIRRDNCISYGLASWEQYRFDVPNDVEWEDVLTAMAFVAQVLELCDIANTDSNCMRAFSGRVHGAFREPAEMRAMQFELHVAVALHRRGCKITWTDESSGTETYDMLVQPVGMPEFELECKSFAIDKGQVNPHSAVTSLLDKLLPRIEQGLPVKPKMLTVLDVELFDKIPVNHTVLDSTAQRIAEAIWSGATVVDGVCELSLQFLDLRNCPPNVEIDQGLAMAIVEKVLGSDASCQVARRFSSDSWGILRIRNSRESRFFQAVEKVAKDAVRRQLTGTRPGCLAMQLHGATGAQLIELAMDEEHNGCTKLAMNLLKSPRHEHLACVAFVSQQQLTRLSETSRAGQGTAYYFDSKVGRFPDLGIGGLFDQVRGALIDDGENLAK